MTKPTAEIGRVIVNLSWKRPQNIPYPNIWKKVEVKSKNGQAHQVQIEDITPERFEEVIDFMAANFDHHEPVCRALELTSDPETVAGRREFRRQTLQQKLSLIATLQEDKNNEKNPEIMGVLFLAVISKNDPPNEYAGNKYKTLIAFHNNYVKKGLNPFQLFNSDIYLDDFGLAVSPKYYGLGLGYQLFACIPQVLKAYNIPGSMNRLTSSFSQALAEKVGFELLKEVLIREYKDEDGKSILPIEGAAKVMILRAEE